MAPTAGDIKENVVRRRLEEAVGFSQVISSGETPIPDIAIGRSAKLLSYLVFEVIFHGSSGPLHDLKAVFPENGCRFLFFKTLTG